MSHIYFIYLDASKATFTASPSSCFLASRNKTSSLPNESTVKNECQQEQGYPAMSPDHHAGLVRGLHTFSNEDSENVPITGKCLKFNCRLKAPLYSALPPRACRFNFSSNTGMGSTH